MEDEIGKHTKKIYTALKHSKEPFIKKLKEIFIEIFIIVFAITLSIWLHNWSDHRHEQIETNEFLKGLRDDLSNDILLIEENKKAVERVDSDFRFIYGLNQNRPIDSVSEKQISHHIYFDLRVTHPNIGRYEGFKSSGKMGTIENDSLKQKILVYYQEMITDLNDVEGIVNSFQTRILDLILDKPDNISLGTLTRTFKMRGLLDLGIQNLHGQIQSYKDAQHQAKKIISLIEEQTHLKQE